MNDEWVITTLGEIAQWGAGGTPKAGDIRFYENGAIPWAVISDVQDSPIEFTAKQITAAGARLIGHLAPANAVLLTMYGTVGRVAITKCEMATNQAIAWGIPDQTVISTEFLFHWLRNHQPKLDQQARGATQRNINRAIIKETQIVLPPLSVQHRIVDVMSHLDNHLRNLRAERDAALIITNALAEELIGEHSISTVREIADPNRGLVGGPFGSSLVSSDYTSHGIPVIRGTNMPKSDMFIEGPFVYVSPAKAASLKSNLANDNDVIFTQRGTLGQVGLVPVGLGPLVISQSQMRLRPNPSLALSEYVFFAFSRPSAVRELKLKNAASANPHINLGILAACEIPLPSIPIQGRICDLLTSANGYRMDLEREVVRAGVLRQTLLKALLTGSSEIPSSYDALLPEVA